MTTTSRQVNGALRWFNEPESSYRVSLTCRRCGHELTPVAQGLPVDGAQSIRATCKCLECGALWVLAVSIAAVKLPPWSGTPQARRHRMTKEERAAHARTAEFARSVGVA